MSRRTALSGQGGQTKRLTVEAVYALLLDTFDPRLLANKRALIIIPDLTWSAPVPLLFRLLYKGLREKMVRLDYLITLGTYPPLGEAGKYQTHRQNFSEMCRPLL